MESSRNYKAAMFHDIFNVVGCCLKVISFDRTEMGLDRILPLFKVVLILNVIPKFRISGQLPAITPYKKQLVKIGRLKLLALQRPQKGHIIRPFYILDFHAI